MSNFTQQIFIDILPEDLMKEIIAVLNKLNDNEYPKVEYNVPESDNEFFVVSTITISHLDSEELAELKVKIEILSSADDSKKYIVNILKKEGDLWDYAKFMELFKE